MVDLQETAGLAIPTSELISAASGGVEVVCRLPEVWPPEADATLFHLGGGDRHVTLFVRKATLLAVYKGDVDHYSSLRCPVDRWNHDEPHRVEFSWLVEDESAVQLTLRVDDVLIGSQQGKLIEDWPETCYLGSRGPGRDAWPGSLQRAVISSRPRPIPELTPGEWTIAVDADHGVGTCYNFWSIDNFTSQDMFADPAMRAPTRQRHPLMRYVNCVRLVGGRSDGKNVFFQGVDADGEPVCDFELLLDYLDGMLDWGYTPRLVLDNVPNAMSRSGEFNKYGNTDPPEDFELWGRYVEALMRALVDHFGMETVGSWRIRAGTEPDLYPGHWSGTPEEYLKHYDHTVAAVCRVIPDADIGPGNILNPAGNLKPGGREPWGLDIIDHAAVGTNHVTGEPGTPLRHFSTSWYGKVGQPIDSFEVAIHTIRDRLDRYPRFRDLPVEVAEFSVLTDAQGRRMNGGETSEWGASWYAAVADRVYRNNVTQVHNWANTWRDLRFARTNVMLMLEKMVDGERLDCKTEGTSAAKCGAIASRRDDRLLLLVYNHRPMRTPKVAEQVTLKVSGRWMSSTDTWSLSEWRVDATHGTAIHAFHADCEAAGLEADLTVPQFGGSSALFDRYGPESRAVMSRNYAKYVALAQLRQTKDARPITIKDGTTTLHLEMPGHGVRLIELRPGQ